MLNDNYFSDNWAQFKTQVKDLFNEMIISKNNITIPTTDFVENSIYDGYTYRATIPITGVTKEYYPFVSFSVDAIKTGLFNNGIVDSYDGGVYIYATGLPTENVVINQIKCIK